jgi:O-antigen/teichoic acid export membrane protein
LQATLSAASLFVGLVLIRYTNDLQYGSFVLVTNALTLMTILQGSFIQPGMVTHMANTDQTGRSNLIGGLIREQRKLLPILPLLCGAGSLILWAAGLMSAGTSLVLLAAGLAATASLYREFFRMVLLAYRRPLDLLKSDLVYVVILCAGVILAIFSSMPAVSAVLMLGVAAAVAGRISSTTLWRHEMWNLKGAPRVFRDISSVGIWSLAGATVHWLFSQGYNYLVAGTLDVTAVAAIAATRLLMMPVNLISAGVGSMILPTAAGWLREHSSNTVLRRMVVFSSALAGVSLCYFAVVWLLRDWIFLVILKKQFDHRDMLVILWSMIFIVMIFRDQLLNFVVARGRVRALSGFTLASALASLVISYFAMLKLGVIGALCGVLLGEILNLAGIVYLAMDERDAALP